MIFQWLVAIFSPLIAPLMPSRRSNENVEKGNYRAIAGGWRSDALFAGKVIKQSVFLPQLLHNGANKGGKIARRGVRFIEIV